MSNFARIDEGKVAEVVELPEGFDIGDAFHEDIAAMFQACGDEVKAGWVFSDGKFSEPVPLVAALEDLKADKILVLTHACAAAITGGYRSSALGAEHTYPSGITDQINMMGSVTASLLPEVAEGWSTPFWCAEEDQWAFRMHSAEQIQQAGSDGKGHVVTCQGTLEQLTSAVISATTADAVEAITWPSL
jgi:hypothetical protein